jgi:hypothetical protein
LIEGLKLGLGGEDLIKAPRKLCLFLRRGCGLVLLQIRIEIPYLGANRLLIFTVVFIEGDELMNKPFSMYSAQPMGQDLELTGIVADNRQPFRDTPCVQPSKQGSFRGKAHMALTGDR